MRVLRRSLSLLLLLCSVSGCQTISYLAQQGLGQLNLLRARRPVEDVIRDPSTPELLRARLRLAMEVRRFGIEVLGLRGGAEFTRFVDVKGPVAYNLSAAQKTRLVPKKWRFPLVGTVPYLGFFKKEDAMRAGRRLDAEGLDVYIRPIGAYSTLGYVLSPIYASMIDDPGERGEVRMVETLLHEMAHTTAWIRSAIDLNESFATVVGLRGAQLFYRLRGRPDKAEILSRRAGEAEEQARSSRELAEWLRPVLRSLDALYRQAQRERWPEAEILRQREVFFERTMLEYRAAFPPGRRYARLARGPINNAVLLSFGIYHVGSTSEEAHQNRRRRNERLQQDLLASVGGDLSAYIDLYRRAQGLPDGAEWLRQRAEEHTGEQAR